MKASRVQGQRDARETTEEPLRVLLISPVRGLDPPNGDVTYTEQLLAAPPEGVHFTTYDKALSEGAIRERFRSRSMLRSDGFASTMREVAIRRARRLNILFREGFRHFEVAPGAFDIAHSHVFSVALSGDRLPLVVSNTIDIVSLYRDGFGRGSLTVRAQAAADRLIARSTGVSHSSFPDGSATLISLSDTFGSKWRAATVDGPVEVIGPFVDVPEPQATPRAADAAFTIGFIGHWKVKGGAAALAAHRALRGEGFSSRLVVVGSPPRLSDAESEHLAITWLPRLPRQELIQTVIPSFDAFVYPSTFDGLPITLLEVMAAGVPVVVSDYGALPEVVEYGNAGQVTPLSDPGATTAALRKLITDPDFRARQGVAGRGRVIARYSADAVSPALGAVYRRLVRAKP